ncbi:MAG TPA: hypothetical protein VJT49_05295 [Amycolatopsis sp.]|uniref:hypothetical protein n=1 Tax=Amycolatopsis sp. TaxID=37632 RepID=UPI002B4A28F6|nr:hypothetical protein [Amycolatopsis sp.]HKS44521.1 hypothetical protein [Amycolatopsis sp.]
MTAHRRGRELFLLTGARWARDFEGGRDVEVTLEGTTTPRRAELVTDQDEVAEIYRRRITELGVQNAQRRIDI